MPLYERSKARRSLFDTITYRVASQVSTVLAYIVLVRATSKADFGVYNLLYSFIPLVGTAASLGLEQTLRRFQPEYLRQDSARAAAWLVKRVTALRFGTNVVVLGIVWLSWNRVAPLFDLGAYRVEFSIFCGLLLLHFQTQVLQLALAAHMLHRFSVGSVAMLSFGKLIGYSALALAGSLNLRNAICVDLFAYLTIYIFLRITYYRRCTASIPKETYRPGSDERKRLVRYGLFNNFNDAGTLFLDSRIDNFFIAAFMDTVAVGIYSFYMRLSEMAVNLLPVRLFDNIIQPMFFSVKPADADRRVPQYFTLLINANLLMLWPMMAFSFTYHAEIVRVVFGGKFVEASWLLPIIMAFAVFNSFATPVALVAQYEEKVHIQLLSKIFAIYNVIALLVLIPLMGIYGAALAIGSAQVMKNSFVWWHVRRRAVWGNAGRSVAFSAALFAGAVALCYGLKSAVPVPAFAQLILGSIVIGCAALINVRGPILCASDREMLLHLFHGKEVRLLRVLGLWSPFAGLPGAH
jgi:O-antigen/teichoic acid export membrane protein